MKNRFVSALLAAALLLTMTGCSVAETVQKLDAAEEQVEATLKSGLTVAEPAAQLTEEQARQIALDHLGITAEETSRLRTTYELDDGVPQFDVELHHDRWEYEFEIHAETGEILSYDQDHSYD